MEETFLINVNCSKILPDCGATQYTMFIDSSKMSIVYELVEWIRWMFSLENCFYLTHENSVIHELEDIQMLSKLKNFEINPCGQPNCVHKKLYRALLKNLNVMVSWNEMKVHKYFLDKVNQISQKLSQGSKICDHATCTPDDKSNKKNIEAENDKLQSSEHQKLKPNLDVANQKLTSEPVGCLKTPAAEGSSSKTNSFFDKMGTEKDNFLLQQQKNFNISNSSENRNYETKKPESTSLNSGSPCRDVGKKLEADEVKSSSKPRTARRYTKPFSLGEVLTNIRQDFEKRNGETSSPKESVSQDSSLVTLERSDKDITVYENSLLMQDKGLVERKRQRTRKRKRSRKQNQEDDYFSPFALESKTGVCSLNISKSNENIKPSHIRFGDETEDIVMKLQSDSGHSENEFEVTNKETDVGNIDEFIRNGGEEELLPGLNGKSKDMNWMISSPKENSDNVMECVPVSDYQIINEKLIDVPNESGQKVSQSFSSMENLEVNGFTPDLSDLLSLREKFKKEIVFQRFY